MQGEAQYGLVVLADQRVKSLPGPFLGLADQLSLGDAVLRAHAAAGACLQTTAAGPGLAGAVGREGCAQGPGLEPRLDTECFGSHRAYTSYGRYVLCKIDVPLGKRTQKCAFG